MSGIRLEQVTVSVPTHDGERLGDNSGLLRNNGSLFSLLRAVALVGDLGVGDDQPVICQRKILALAPDHAGQAA